jgi:hypothetical protein
LNKYYIYSVIIAFFCGLVVAGTGTAIFIRGHVDTNIKSMDRSYLASWEQHSNDAYENEAPEVAMWVLQRFATLLESRLTKADPKDRVRMHRNLLLSYTRLAHIYKKTGRLLQYEENLTLALKMARKVSPETITNEAELFQILSHAENK